MSRVIGIATLADLARLRDRGLTPKQAVKALQDEARRRYPGETIVVTRSAAHSGFDIIVF